MPKRCLSDTAPVASAATRTSRHSSRHLLTYGLATLYVSTSQATTTAPSISSGTTSSSTPTCASGCARSTLTLPLPLPLTPTPTPTPTLTLTLTLTLPLTRCEINASPAVAEELLPAFIDSLVATAIDPFFPPVAALQLAKGTAGPAGAAAKPSAPPAAGAREGFELVFRAKPQEGCEGG